MQNLKLSTAIATYCGVLLAVLDSVSGQGSASCEVTDARPFYDMSCSREIAGNEFGGGGTEEASATSAEWFSSAKSWGAGQAYGKSASKAGACNLPSSGLWKNLVDNHKDKLTYYSNLEAPYNTDSGNSLKANVWLYENYNTRAMFFCSWMTNEAGDNWSCTCTAHHE